MGAESGWAAAVGVSAGILSWVVGLGNILWPKHPQWALFLIAAVVTIVCMLILERSDARTARLARS
jgi:hypothetical protein